MEDTPNPSSEKPKKKIITVGVDRETAGADRDNGGGDRRGGKGRRGGRGRDRDERDRKPAVPPALMRGPKPKPKADVEETPELSETPAEETPVDNTVEAVAAEEVTPADIAVVEETAASSPSA
jgi:hypothetical protein